MSGRSVAFGNAVISRWPITASEGRDLPDEDGDREGRSVLRAEVDGPRGPIELYSTHLHWKLYDSHVRQAQVATIGELIAEHRDGRTYPAGYPRRGGAGHPVSARLAGPDPVDGVVPSDHLAVVADLRY